MQFILINELEEFGNVYRNLASRKSDLIIEAKLPFGRNVVVLNLPPIVTYPSPGFSIVQDTLYWGRQWIGTISESQDTTTPCLHINQRAQECFKEYLIQEEQRIRMAAQLVTPPPPFLMSQTMDLAVKAPIAPPNDSSNKTDIVSIASSASTQFSFDTTEKTVFSIGSVSQSTTKGRKFEGVHKKNQAKNSHRLFSEEQRLYAQGEQRVEKVNVQSLKITSVEMAESQVAKNSYG